MYTLPYDNIYILYSQSVLAMLFSCLLFTLRADVTRCDKNDGTTLSKGLGQIFACGRPQGRVSTRRTALMFSWFPSAYPEKFLDLK